ncbi:hypothetical protein Q8F55_006164 [Vanrija albida]|uniref:RanBP2-type domain-containing protein n=1 Tax=Vanrija albida TaxID=181172 RepID=A0ABR3PWJ1_9TREE
MTNSSNTLRAKYARHEKLMAKEVAPWLPPAGHVEAKKRMAKHWGGQPWPPHRPAWVAPSPGPCEPRWWISCANGGPECRCQRCLSNPFYDLCEQCGTYTCRSEVVEPAGLPRRVHDALGKRFSVIGELCTALGGAGDIEAGPSDRQEKKFGKPKDRVESYRVAEGRCPDEDDGASTIAPSYHSQEEAGGGPSSAPPSYRPRETNDDREPCVPPPSYYR